MDRTPFRLTPEQYAQLTQGLDANRVGKNPKGFSHLEAWDVRRWLIRIFGFGNVDIENTIELVKEIEHPQRRRKDKKGVAYGDPYTPWTVVYRAQTRLTIRDQFGAYVVIEDGACGDSTNQPSVGDCHDNAMKTALSQALKRCAVNLGDQFGLSLYNNGSIKPVVIRSLVAPESAAAPAELAAEDEPVRPEPGTATAQPADEHQADPPAAAAPAAEAPTADSVRDWALEPDRTAEGVRKAAAKLTAEHPAVAATRVVNEHGDEEQLSVLLDRRAKEPAPAAAAPAAGRVDPTERRRTRMHALFNELGYGGAENREQRLTVMARLTGVEAIASSNDLDADQVERVITGLDKRKRELAAQQRQSGGKAA